MTWQAIITDLMSPWALPLLLVLASVFARGRVRNWLGMVAGLTALGMSLEFPASALVVVGSALFALANAVQLARLASNTRKGLMSAEEQALIAEVLAIEEPAKQRRLRDVITWRDAETGEVLIRQGQIAPPLIYIATGKMDIEHEGLPVGTCGPDDFIGEMSLVSGEGASATVKVAMPARIAEFDREGVQRLAAAMPEFSRALDRALNRGLSAKIQRMNKATRETWNFGG